MIGRWLSRVTAWLDQGLVSLYSSPNPGARRYLLAPVYHLRRLMMFLSRGLTLKVYAIEGAARGTGLPLRAVYFEEGRGRAYLMAQLFEPETAACRALEPVRFWQLQRAAQSLANQADLVIVEENTLLGWRPKTGRWLSAPTWVRMVQDIDSRMAWAELEKTFHKHERNIRRVQRSGFQPAVSREAQDFELFYDRMYVPFVQGRHPGFGHIDTRAHLFSLFQHGFLLFILDSQGRRVAADLVALYGDVYFGVACGVLDNDETLLEAGAISALYYYALQWCHAHQIRRCDIGEIRPFAGDGLYQYKRRWGYRPEKELWNTREWVFWVPRESPAALEWLAANPLLEEFKRETPETA